MNIRLLTVLILLGACLIGPSAYPACVVKDGDVLDICGDSITQQGLYSVFVEEYLLMCQPLHNLKVIQCGWSGTTAPHLATNMKFGALTFSPTIATTCYGMNDGHYDNTNEEIEKDYRDGLTKVVENFKSAGVRTVLVGSPGVVDLFYFHNPKHKEVTANDYIKTLGRLGEIGKEVAQAEGVLFADLHNPMVEAMIKAKAALGEKYPVTGNIDGVHPGPNGHLIMAYGFLKAMGVDGNIGTITFDATGNKAEATEGHRVVSVNGNEITIESTRYPYCFTKGNDHPNSATASILPFLPFNEELNRYMLVVKNLKYPKAKVTWGNGSKEFTSAQLEKGINLAAEFIDNPFVVPFMAVDRLVSIKQGFQVMLVKDYLCTNEPSLSARLFTCSPLQFEWRVSLA